MSGHPVHCVISPPLSQHLFLTVRYDGHNIMLLYFQFETERLITTPSRTIQVSYLQQTVRSENVIVRE